MRNLRVKLIGLLISLSVTASSQTDSVDYYQEDWQYLEIDSVDIHIREVNQIQQRAMDKLDMLEEYFKHEDDEPEPH